ncbi:serine/arginine repetitive matrix protein 2-like isoform X2 [Sander lucioperca]|uniref:serine/arginine repetitive matrix protein 2-like isoform X2 n=1 Tax=Sander lucioperca TaxID=283035 RepID=UPI00125D326B|nr:serine/arginine repetitive matrix protein 2-like isoform X2 [Sander lucioperca]
MEDEIRTTETEQGDVASNEGESSVEMSNSPTKKGRGRPQGSKKLKVCVTDVNLMELVSGISNGGSTQTPRKRGRPKRAEQQGAGDDHADDSVQTQGSKKHASNEDSLTTDPSPKKRGRPRKSLSYSTPEKADTKDVLNGDSETPKARWGRPKGSTKRKSESLTSEETEGGLVTQRSLNKKLRLETELSSEGEEDAGVSQKPPIRRSRGRPRKVISQERGDKEQAKRERGRPKGSVNKKPAKRGRPRKYPLPSPEELKKPKVWKPLGRPRKYPRVDPPEGSLPAPRRSRGRPRKSESKKGAHLRKNLPASSSSPCNPNVESPRKRGRPPSTQKKDAGTPRKRGRPPSTPKKDAGTPRKRGRPKGSVNKKDGHSKAKGDSSPVGVEHEAELAKDEVEHDDAEDSMEPDTEASIVDDTEASIVHDTEMTIMDNTEESLIDQDASFEVSNQA